MIPETTNELIRALRVGCGFETQSRAADRMEHMQREIDRLREEIKEKETER